MESIRTPERRLAFLTVLADTANVSRACSGAGIGRTAAYQWRNDDLDFKKSWDEALEIGIGALEDEAHRRAFEGTDEPVHYLGQRCDTIKKYSDTLAIFLLKAHRPDKYRERFEGQLSGDMTLNLSFGRRGAD